MATKQPDTRDESESQPPADGGCLNPLEEHPSDCPGPASDAGAIELCWPCHYHREYGRLPVPYSEMAEERGAA